MKTLILYIDALGFNLINKENTPFLYNYGKENSLLRLKTLLAYTGIENAFITGKLPVETGIWVEFIYKKNLIGNLLKFIPLPNSLLSYIYALLNYLKGNTFLSKLHNIPRKFFSKFNSSVKDGLWKSEYFQNKSFVFYAWPFFVKNNKIKLDIIKRNDEYKVKKFIKSFDEKIDVYFIHLVDLDKVLHEFGVSSLETKEELQKQDNYANLIINEFKYRFKNSKIIIWSDHGFADIKGFINIEKEIKNLKDIDYFLDSTIARFWLKNHEARKALINKLNKIKNSHILTKEEKIKFNIPLSSENGEIIFLADPGFLILPNFYQGNHPCKGMHGYNPEKIDIDGLLIINKKLNKKSINMNEVLYFLENMSFP